MNDDESIKRLEIRLARVDEERSAIVSELEILKQTKRSQRPAIEPLGRPTSGLPPATPSEKIDLFLRLFRCRQNVFPKRWENPKSGKQGYSPLCQNEWVKPICKKPQIKCSDCTYQKFQSLNSEAAEAHLKGTITIGTYAIREDDSCVFLACDFDESTWRQDASAYKQAAASFGIDVAIERSRSGNGAHAWIFFEQTIPARLARSLGTVILARCSETNVKLSLDSYDRFFPSQDYLPRGGFGNLIALPLQKVPRENGNSCFIDEAFDPIKDQWEYLFRIRRLSLAEVRKLLDFHVPKLKPWKRDDAFDDISWHTDVAILEKSSNEGSEAKLNDTIIEIAFGSQLSIPLESLPGPIVGKLRKSASFPNPEFYKLQRMRMQTYPHRRFIFSGELSPDHMLLPRGVLDEVTRILTLAGAKVVIRDERIARKKIKAEFSGELKDLQESALKVLKGTDIGILMAPPGAGKTVMGCALIAQRKVSTLILVHRQPLLEQWKERIEEFLGIPRKEIGVLSGTKKKTTGKIDLAMLQSLTKLGDISEVAERYSQIIIDECHHIPAVSFADILKQLPARYVVGLTATPYRKDGLEKILFQQCGPIRHRIESVDGETLIKTVSISETGFRPPEELGPKPPYHALIHALVNDSQRNENISRAGVTALQQSRLPLLISDRKGHLELLSHLIKSEFEKIGSTVETILLLGEMSNKQRKEAIELIGVRKSEKRPVILMATASLIGEGFDMPELDTLILAMPLSFEGRMIQYAGRLHRTAEGKDKVQIIDFLDSYSPMFLKMYRNRLKAYRTMGYTITEPTTYFGKRIEPVTQPTLSDGRIPSPQESRVEQST